MKEKRVVGEGLRGACLSLSAKARADGRANVVLGAVGDAASGTWELSGPASGTAIAFNATEVVPGEVRGRRDALWRRRPSRQAIAGEVGEGDFHAGRRFRRAPRRPRRRRRGAAWRTLHRPCACDGGVWRIRRHAGHWACVALHPRAADGRRVVSILCKGRMPGPRPSLAPDDIRSRGPAQACHAAAARTGEKVALDVSRRPSSR